MPKKKIPVTEITEPMENAAHSDIGASGMDRWSQCPGSVRLSAGLAGNSSVHAKEGTAAHAYAEKLIRHDFQAALISEVFEYEDHGEKCEIPITEEMADAVNVYVDYARHLHKDGFTVLVEQKFDLSEIHPGLFGTSDLVAYHPEKRLLIVLDFKYGAGVAVEARNNPQLRYYAVGALWKYRDQWQVDEVQVGIVQPRCAHPEGSIRWETLSRLDLLEWTADLKQYAQATADPDAPLLVGDHCRWCKAAAVPGRCQAQEDARKQALKLAFTADEPFTVEDLEKALDLVPVMEQWCKSVHEFAYAQAEQGKVNLTRYKLVAKRATRKWQDPEKALAALRMLTNLADDRLLSPPVLRSPKQIEDCLSGKAEKSVLDDLTVKESSGHSLVHITDKRPAVALDAKSAFEALPVD